VPQSGKGFFIAKLLGIRRDGEPHIADLPRTPLYELHIALY